MDDTSRSGEPVRVREKLEPPPRALIPPAGVRLAIGGVILASHKISELLAEWSEMAAGEIEAAPDGEETASIRHVLIGLTAAVTVVVKEVAEAARPVIDRLIGSLSDERVPAPVRSLLQMVEQQRRELADAGSREELRSVALAQTAFRDAVERMFAALSESPELAELIRDQTTGIGRDAVNELRDVALRADTASELLLRRLARRPPRDPLDPIMAPEALP